jgi:hypothetical protein
LPLRRGHFEAVEIFFTFFVDHLLARFSHHVMVWPIEQYGFELALCYKSGLV